jgi:cell division transport system permease protein
VAVLVLVGLTVLFIVINTIRLAVVARAEEIEIMRLVGASDAFIRWPFIFEGMLVGIFGAAITLGVLALAAQPIGQGVATLVGQVPIQFDQNLDQQLVVVVGGAGLVLGAGGAFISVRAYLIR